MFCHCLDISRQEKRRKEKERQKARAHKISETDDVADDLGKLITMETVVKGTVSVLYLSFACRLRYVNYIYEETLYCLCQFVCMTFEDS